MNMKKTIGMLLAAGIVGLSTAVLSAVSVGGRVPAPRTAGSVNAGLDLMPDIVSGLNLLAGEKYETIPSANGIGVWNGEEVVPMDTEDYIIHVTAAEMPATYEKEALKAQAVAARTFAMKHLTGELRCKSGHTICTDYACCQAFLTTEQLRERWGSSFENYYARMEAAVHETEGLVLTSGGELVTALYHSSSGGRTENCEAVFAVALPYLVSVESGGEEDSPEFTSEKCYTTAEFISKVNSAFPDAQMSDPAKDVDVWQRTESGRIQLIRLGGTVVTGQQLRNALKLRSTNVKFSITQSNVKITCFGFGHGVGMSQCGANAMAKNGSSFDEILRHYYTGVDIERFEVDSGELCLLPEQTNE